MTKIEPASGSARTSKGKPPRSIDALHSLRTHLRAPGRMMAAPTNQPKRQNNPQTMFLYLNHWSTFIHDQYASR